ncbi:ATP-binding protein [Hyalangium rubrum]|uniref:histidine kinase n=1 Tax=Hyalangium rubrum TaxID=3103134 RepID=A0ABU5H4Y4_9BACT|nr:ATP-binding protein [Hyalangium sp. s54d21]MDY7228172.1 GAF domain-containing protein [Hyalangium sp. s54d21]
MSETRQRMSKQSMERLLRLQGVTSGLSQALTPEQVTRIIVDQAGPTLDATEWVFYLFKEPGVLRLAGRSGLHEMDLDPWHNVSVNAPVPVAEVVRQGEPVWVESVEILRQRYPILDGVRLHPPRALAFVPLQAESKMLGVLALGFAREQGFSEEDKDFALLVATQCAQALERAHLYAKERELREVAERARAEAEAQRRLLELEHRRLQAVLQQMPQGVLLVEAPSGRLLMTNAHAEPLLRGVLSRARTQQEPLCLAGGCMEGRSGRPKEGPLVRALTRGEVVRDEIMDVPREGGGRVTLEVSAGPVRDAEGRVTAAVAVLEDITERLRMEQAIREGEAVFRRFMETDLMGLSFCDQKGVILEANRAFLKLTGHQRKELGSLRWGELVAPEKKEIGARALRELWDRGVTTVFELVLLRGDGTRVPVMTGSARVEELDRVLTFVLDLSDLKHAEGALRFLATASHVLGQSLEVSDATLQEVARLASRSVASWCIIDLATPEGLLRRAAVAHQGPEQEARLREAWPLPAVHDSGGPLLETLHSGKPLLFPDFSPETWRYLVPGASPARVQGTAMACSVLVVPMRLHDRALGLVTMGSCRPQRRFGTEDISLGQELTHRVASSLESARLFLESQRAVRLRDEFLAVASHELKTPLTPLRLQFQGLRRVVESKVGEPVSPERVLRAVHGCESQVRKLAGLVNDLLDVARLAQGRLPLHLEVVDLVEVTRELLEQFSTEFGRAGCRVEFEAGAPVLGFWDRLRLEQVATNLLTNALKYGAGRPIRVRVWQERGVAWLSVRDEGIGIAPEHRSRIFGKFERAVSERHYGGLGLGLHITQQIVGALGGSIQVESEPGHGSTFTVALASGEQDTIAQS